MLILSDLINCVSKTNLNWIATNLYKMHKSQLLILYMTFNITSIHSEQKGNIRQLNLSRRNEYFHQLSKTLRYICSTFFPEEKLISLINSEQDNDLIESLLHERMRPTIITTHNHLFLRYSNIPGTQFPRENDVIIIFADTKKPLTNVVQCEEQYYWNNKAHFLLIYFSCNHETFEENFNVFIPESFRRRISKFVVMCMPSGIYNKKVVHYFSSETSDVLIVSHNLHLQKYSKTHASLHIISKVNAFFWKTYAAPDTCNFQGYQLRTSTLTTNFMPIFSFIGQGDTFVSGGYFSKILQQSSMYLNYTIRHVKVNGFMEYGFQLTNGSWSGVVGEKSRFWLYKYGCSP